MKTACLMLATICCPVFVHGTSYAFSPHTAPREPSSVSSTTSSVNAHRTDAASAENRKRQKVGAHSDRTRRHISGKNDSHNRTGPMKATRPKQVRNSREPSTSEHVTNVRGPSLSKPPVGAEIANRRSLPVRAAGVAGLNGTQLKDSHNRGVAPAIIGRTASATKGTAAINGTRINRMHVN